MKPSFKNISIILIILLALNTAQIFVLYNTRKYGDIDFYNLGTHFFMFMIGVLSLVSTVLSWKLLNKFTKGKRAVFTLGLSLIIFTVLTSLYFICNRSILGHETSLNMLIGNAISTYFTTHLFISAYAVAYLYFVHSKALEINIQQLENEKMHLNSSLLKQNLEPHFLFNNLSVLRGLVRRNPEKIDDFMDSFSEVYRYYLKHNQQDFVKLQDEISFLEEYLYLMQTRFGASYKCKIEIPDRTGFVLPCSLQLCVENAVKHNYASEENPLLIKVYRQNNFIFIENEIRKIEGKSNGVGNEYLKRRYEIIFNKEVETTIENNHYLIKIPVIQ